MIDKNKDFAFDRESCPTTNGSSHNLNPTKLSDDEFKVIERQWKKKRSKVLPKDMLEKAADFYMENYDEKYFLSYDKRPSNDFKVRQLHFTRKDIIEALKTFSAIVPLSGKTTVYSIEFESCDPVYTFRKRETDNNADQKYFYLECFRNPYVPADFWREDIKGLNMKFPVETDPMLNYYILSEDNLKKLDSFMEEYGGIWKEMQVLGKKTKNFLQASTNYRNGTQFIKK